MSVKRFKFVSPGVFINEIDNSFVPKSAQEIGPVVIGRSTRGLAMQPVKVESYSEFVDMFGDTVPGFGGGDIYRDGNFQSPMYGTYTAKGFLNANVAPLTYMRLLGTQDSNAAADGAYNGWKTANNPGTNTLAGNGGAFGLFVFPSGSSAVLGTGSLGAIWYCNENVAMGLSGTVATGNGTTDVVSGALATVVDTDSDGCFTLAVESVGKTTTYTRFNFDDSSDNYVRERFNTNPQLVNSASVGTGFYPTQTRYWLGESYRQQLEEDSLITNANGFLGVLLPLALSGTASTGPHNLSNISPRWQLGEAKAGWFIGQDLGATGSFVPENTQKLFRLKGRGHGEWINRNMKVSIEKLRVSNSTLSDYGTFSVLLRSLSDTDNNVEVIERFDNCTLDPASPNFVARKIGDTYSKWNATERRLRKYGEYPNLSKFVYVQMNADVEAGATDPTLLPFGYYAPPKFQDLNNISGSFASGSTPTFDRFVFLGSDVYNFVEAPSGSGSGPVLSGTVGGLTGSLKFPSHQVRLRDTDGGLTDTTRASFGFRTTRAATSTQNDTSVRFLGRLLYATIPDDPTNYNPPVKNTASVPGIDLFEDIITLNNVTTASAGVRTYVSGARALGQADASYATLLGAGYDSFTAPFWGGFDGFDIKKPDPVYNSGMSDSSKESTDYIYNTWKQAIDTLADPEFVDINLMLAPGLTQTTLTQHMINVCADRADCLSLIDLPDVYIPPHEKYIATKPDRLGTTPRGAADSLRDRRIDSSYGCTFYPWVQTRDENTGQLVWIPPSVAMAGVLASSQAKSDVWFAPAGFNRGGLTDGAAGIPVVNVTERIISKDRDILYEARINPIASFPSTGIVVFGQKTLQERASALDRINVRRLVIYLKKQISILASQVLFEQNVEATWNRFKTLVEPFLANVKVAFGITDYKLILDSSTTTPDLIDQNIMYAKIMIKPARAIEYIAIDFVVTSTGASFDD